jgi:3-deoxy-7-phosphoheptulonate synthase
MDIKKLLDTNIESSQTLITPVELKQKLPLTETAAQTVLNGRQAIQNILDGRDSRKFIIVGPCSIHDPNAAFEYAKRLKKLSDRVQDRLLIVMRVYFEKPRTTVGWKGLINDPDLDDSFKIEKGLFIARQLLLKIAELGLPTATETLDPITPRYISELISWSAIGARTIESQTHREMTSGLSMPVGLKNSTDGNIKVALDALMSSRAPHNFLGISEKGEVSVFKTRGNPYGHIILRGGGGKPNYDPKTVKQVVAQLKELNLPPRLVVDCSHGNSNKNHELQSAVLENVIQQIVDGHQALVGMMLESNLYEGNQSIPSNFSTKVSVKDKLAYGVSVTDKCIGWNETERIILAAYDRLESATKELCNV